MRLLEKIMYITRNIMMLFYVSLLGEKREKQRERETERSGRKK